MPLYTMIYSAYCILLSSDKFRKGQVKSMDMDREFMVFENDIDWSYRKRFQSLDADDFRRTIFAERMEKFRI